MNFYLLPYQTYLDNYHEVVDKTPAISLFESGSAMPPDTMCIIETSYEIQNYTMQFDTALDVRNWWAENEEWRNWVDEEDYL